MSCERVNKSLASPPKYLPTTKAASRVSKFGPIRSRYLRVSIMWSEVQARHLAPSWPTILDVTCGYYSWHNGETAPWWRLLYPPSSAFADGVVGGLGRGLQGLLGGRPVVQGPGRGVVSRSVVPQDGRQVTLELVAVRQLREAGEAVQVGHLVEGAQQEVHHHEAHKQVDCRGGGARGTRSHGRLRPSFHFSFFPHSEFGFRFIA